MDFEGQRRNPLVCIPSDCLRSLSFERVTFLDGEIVALDEKGRPSFQKLQGGFRSVRADHAYFYAFDLLNLEGHDLTRLPIEQRKELLESALGNATGRVRLSSPLEGEPATLREVIAAHGLEGLVAKRKGSRYEPGKRTATWVKYKCGIKETFLIGGYIPIRSTGVGVGALLVGYRDAEGRLRFAGRVGSGFRNKSRKELLAAFDGLRRPDSPFSALPIVLLILCEMGTARNRSSSPNRNHGAFR